MLLTSCEGTLDDVFGEWDKPSANTNTNPSSDPTPAASNNYMAWDGTALAAEAIPTTGIQEVTDATTSFEGGFYIVKKDVTIPAPGILINADTKLILCDGASLTVNGFFEDQSVTTTYSLTIYGQENQTGKLIVNAPTDCCGTIVKDLEIHGGDVSFTGAPKMTGIMPSGDVTIYGGKVTATGGDSDGVMPGAAGIDCGGNLTIKGEAVVKAYGGAISGTVAGGKGINVGGTIDITGSADVYCKGRGNHSLYAEGNIVLSATKVEAESPVADGNAHGIFSNTGDITISGGTVIAAANANAIIASNLVINGGTVTATSTSNFLEAIRGWTTLNITTGVNKVEMINPSANSDPTVADANLFAGTGGSGTITLGGVDTNYTTWNGYSVSGAIAAYPKLSYDGTTRTLTYNPN